MQPNGPPSAMPAPGGRIATRATLPETQQMPQRGIVALSGGLMSKPSRIAIDADACTATNGSTTFAIERAVVDQLMQLAHAAWHEPPPSFPFSPTMDYDETLYVLDGDAVFRVQGYGPLRQPAAAAAIKATRIAGKL